jgi:hypothetical protein
MADERSEWAVGWTWFAVFMMVLIGVWHAIAGLAAILDDEFYVVTPNYVFEFDATTWGWIHLIAGIVVALAAYGVSTGAVWGRTVGVIMAAISGIAVFAWLPWYPVWGILILLLDIAVIWALTVHGRDITMA